MLQFQSYFRQDRGQIWSGRLKTIYFIVAYGSHIKIMYLVKCTVTRGVLKLTCPLENAIEQIRLI